MIPLNFSAVVSFVVYAILVLAHAATGDEDMIDCCAGLSCEDADTKKQLLGWIIWLHELEPLYKFAATSAVSFAISFLVLRTLTSAAKMATTVFLVYV